MSAATLLHDARRIAPLAWPVFVGQVAVLAFGTVDTLIASRASALDLAALAIGSAVYVTVFIALMGLVLAVGPIAGQLFGAGKHAEAGAQLHQAMWLALGASTVGCLLLLFPQPFLNLSQASPEVAAKVRGYLTALAFALPFALVFTAFRGFNTAVSRPKIVMLLQLAALLLKVPMSAMLVFGFSVGEWKFAAQGAPGCGMATAIVMACQLAGAWWLLRNDPFYARFGLQGKVNRPHRASLRGLLRLGVPLGASIAIEVTGFTFMALFISRIGATSVAGHQIALNMLSILFMLPMAIGNATSSLVAQRIGANDAAQAQQLGWNGLRLGLIVAAVTGCIVYALRLTILHAYTSDPSVIAAALPLLAWLVLFHIADAAQIIAAHVLRAYRVATVPVLIYAAAIWGVGLGGGYVLAFDVTGVTPRSLQGAPGYWAAATAGLVCAGLGLCFFLGWMLRRRNQTLQAQGR
ncbi:MAG: MATE family efflux transporter [Burkholderiaceae bacterium]